MDFSTLKTNDNSPLYKQLVEWFEDEIAAGRLKAGDRVPSTDDFAKQTKIGRKVIQKALEVISERGLLERSPKRGTFLSEGVATQNIGIVIHMDLLKEQVFGFHRLLCNEIIEILHKKKYSVELIFPSASKNLKKVKQEVREKAANGKFRGVIYFGNLGIEKLSIPIVNSMVNASVDNKYETFVYRGLMYLLTRGYRAIAIIKHSRKYMFSKLEQDGIDSLKNEFSSDFSYKLYLGSNNDLRYNGVAVMTAILEDEGFKPDAVLCMDDNLTRGVIFKLMERGLKIPDDIALLSHSNKGAPIMSPVELTKLENDPHYFAVQAVEILESKLEGRPSKIEENRPKLIVGESCGEK